eukprot:6212564-Pleurochrysis_carterae.AAC.3
MATVQNGYKVGRIGTPMLAFNTFSLWMSQIIYMSIRVPCARVHDLCSGSTGRQNVLTGLLPTMTSDMAELARLTHLQPEICNSHFTFLETVWRSQRGKVGGTLGRQRSRDHH